MKRFFAICALLAVFAAPAKRPGWLGFGFVYHPPSGSADGWMYVRAIAPDSPAQKGGLKPQDVITRMNAKRLRFANDNEVLDAFEKIQPDERVALRVRRGTDTIDVIVVAVPMPDDKWELWQRNRR